MERKCHKVFIELKDKLCMRTLTQYQFQRHTEKGAMTVSKYIKALEQPNFEMRKTDTKPKKDED